MFKGLSSLLFLLLFNISSWAANPLVESMHQAAPAIVAIETQYIKNRGNKQIAYERIGTGTILDPQGLIVTNTHIIRKAPSIFVILNNGARLPARVIFTSSQDDFSFLKVKTLQPLKALSWGSASHIRAGQTVMTLSRPNLNKQYALVGTITEVKDLFTTNLNLNKGDSGSPILDLQGRFLGLITAKSKHHTLTIAIPSTKIRQHYLRYKRKLP